MQLVPFNCEKANETYKHFYNQQGHGSIPIFSGQRDQKGYGIGSIFGSILKAALPVVKQGAISLGKTALKTGVNIAKDTLQGKNIKQSFSDNIKQAGSEVLNNAIGHVTNRRKVVPNKTVRRKRKGVSVTRKVSVKRRKKNRRQKANRDIFE